VFEAAAGDVEADVAKVLDGIAREFGISGAA